MKRGNIILLSILGIGAAIGTILLIRRTNAQAAEPASGGNNNSGGTAGGGIITGGSTGGSINNAPGLSYNTVLRFTSGTFANRAEVKELQRLLNRAEAAEPLVIDGMFGPKTEAKLKRLNGGFGEITLAQAKLKWPY